jgi:hypothetical protein
MSRLCEDGVDADELPNGRGEFGWDPANPIPCNTVFGSTVYLSRLRASDGAKVVYTRARGLSHRKRRRIRWMPMKYRILMGAN